MDSCKDSAVATLAEQDLCLNHFFCICYERLEKLEPMGPKLQQDSAELASRKDFVEECSREALQVGLRCKDLSNLQRGRLLDILLWAGDLFIALRQRIVVPVLTGYGAENSFARHENSQREDPVSRKPNERPTASAQRPTFFKMANRVARA